MNKLKVIALAITFLLIFLNSQVQSRQINQESMGISSLGNIRYVDDSNLVGPWDGTINFPYKTINDAILNCTEGDTIFVFNGTYFENIVINKRISIIGEGKSIIDGMYQDYAVYLNCDNIVLKDLIFRNSGGFDGNSCIFVNSDNNLIIDSEIYRARTGLLIKNGNNNEIKNTVFYSNGEGIKIESSQDIDIRDCIFYHNSFASEVHHSKNIAITNCYYHTNGIGLLLNDSMNINISKCAIYNNNDNQGGVMMYFCENVSICNCNFEHNGFGISIDDCSDIYITYSDFVLHDHEAFWIKTKSENVNIENCEIYDNFRFGISIFNGNCNLKQNNIYGNLFGLYIEKSYCDARKNWWGKLTGPALFERKVKDRMFPKFGIIRFFPWLLKKNENAGPDWEIDYEKYPVNFNASRYKQITFSGNDTDFDGVPDWWEEKYDYDPFAWDNHTNLDPDNDGLNNIEECYTDQWGSNPFKKDLFIEVDYFDSESNKPTDSWINEMAERFGEHEITLHIDAGQLGGGELINYDGDFYYEHLNDIYWDYFLHNDLNNPRKGIFHYCFVKNYGPYPGFSGFSIFGWDNLDSWVLFPDGIKDKFPSVSRDRIIISVIMHEFGHTMGLFADDCGGNDNMVATMPFTKQFFKYSTYRSIMNYMYTYRILDYSDGKLGRNDFDDWGNLDLSFFKNTSFILPYSSKNIS